MIPLTIGVAIFDEHTRFASLEIDNVALRLAAIGTAEMICADIRRCNTWLANMTYTS